MALVQGALRKGNDAAAGKIPGRTPQGKSNEDVRVKMWPIPGGAVDLAIRASCPSELGEEQPIPPSGGPPWDALERLSVVAFTPSHGWHRADVAKKQILASQSKPAAFRAVGARLTAALTHHDSALRREAGCVPTRRRQTPRWKNTG